MCAAKSREISWESINVVSLMKPIKINSSQITVKNKEIKEDKKSMSYLLVIAVLADGPAHFDHIVGVSCGSGPEFACLLSSYLRWMFHKIPSRKPLASILLYNKADSKVHGANMGPTWVLSAPDGPHVDPMKLATRDSTGRFDLYPSGLLQLINKSLELHYHWQFNELIK